MLFTDAKVMIFILLCVVIKVLRNVNGIFVS